MPPRPRTSAVSILLARLAIGAAILALIGPATAVAQPARIDCSLQTTLDAPSAPLLVVTNEAYGANPFGCYLTEILRGEGLVEFQHARLALVDAEIDPLAFLQSYAVVVLAETSLTPTEEQLFRDYVSGGGRLVAMRPDSGIADVVGLTYVAPRAEQLRQFFAVDTASEAGAGIVADSLQYHGEADDYTLNGATAIADLWDDLSTPSASPATTLHAFGSGQAAAFTFDVARSVVLTRQGNPAWADTEGGDLSGYRPGHDLFYQSGSHYNEPERLTIPQADELQRFLANLILSLVAEPLPRMWYLPGTHKRVVISTGDGESDAGTSLEPPMDAVESYGGFFTHYLREPGITGTSIAMEADWRARGHETGVHAFGTDSDPSYGTNTYDPIVASLQAKFGHGSRTARNHTIDWVGWSEMAEFLEAAGTGMDFNYYHIPYYLGSGGTANGFFTGSSLPQRFSDENGVLLGIYQQLTQWPDEWFANSGLTATAAENIVTTMLDEAVTEERYGAYANNIHPPRYNGSDITSTWANAHWAYCQANGIPMWSAEMLLDFVEARNAATFSNIVWSSGSATLGFDFATPTAHPELTVLIPIQSPVGQLLSVDRDAAPVAYATETIKGVEYAMVSVPGTVHAVVATYGIDSTAPIISNVQVTDISDVSATITWDTDEPATSVVDYGTSSGNLTLQESALGLVTSHSVTLTGLSASSPYFFEVTSADAVGNPASSTESSFSTGLPRWTETSDTDFGDGAATNVEIVGMGDACLQLGTASGFFEPFDGASLDPLDWTERSWVTFGAPPPGAITVAGGTVTVTDSSYIRTTATYFEETVEGQVTLNDGGNAHFGWATTVQGGDDGITDPEWAMFSVQSGSYRARTLANDGGGTVDTDIGAFATPGTSHDLRIEWLPGGQIDFYVDDVLVTSHDRTWTNPMRVYLSAAAPPQTVVADQVSISGAFASAGTYASSVFDSGGTADWSELLWIGDQPPSTSVDFETRSSVDGVAFSAWQALAGDAIVSPDGQYAQYRATLATSDVGSTPEVCEVALSYAPGPDLSPPDVTISDPVDTATDVAVGNDIVIDFAEPIVPGTFSVTISGGVGFSVSFQNGDTRVVIDPDVDLDPSTAYTVTIAAGLEDTSGNATLAPIVFDFTTSAATLPVCLVDDLRADFASGALSDTRLAEVDDGELVLGSVEATEFDGVALPSGWSLLEDWTGSGSASVAGGSLIVEQANVGTTASYGPGRAIEFVATFVGGEDNQHVGFGDTFSSTPWAMFSTGTSGGGSCATCLQARTWLGPPEAFINETIDVTGAYLGSPHLFRIEWTATEVTYYVDGAQVAQHIVALAGPLGARVSDISTGSSLVVDWMRLSPYTTPGTFESRIADAGGAVDWDQLVYASDLPTGTSVTLEVRTGDTATPDGSWSAYAPIASGVSVAANARYLQYRATLATTDVDRTPALEDVAIRCDDTAPPVIVSSEPAEGAVDVPVDAGLLLHFNEPIVPGTFSASISGGVGLSVSFLDGDTTALLMPVSDLQSATAYTVSVDPGLEDLNGNATVAAQRLHFTTTSACFVETTLAHFADGSFVDTETVAVGDGAVQLASGENEVAVLSDGFDEPDGPASSWTPLDGIWNIASGEYGFTIGSNYAVSIVTGQSLDDFTIVSSQKIVSHTSIGVGGYVWHVQNPTGAEGWKNGAYMLQWDTRTGTLENARIFRWDSPTTLTLVAGVDLADVVLDQDYELRLEVRGAQFDLFIDGAPVLSGSDATYGAGAVGLVGWVDGVTRYDDVVLSSLESGFLTSGDYTSNVADSGTSTTWTQVAWSLDEPASTLGDVSVRVGDSAVPDGGWTAFTPVASSGSPVDLIGRYAQYRVDLASQDPMASPELLEIQMSCQPTCGDGLPNTGEECDDGNGQNGDGCSSTCSFESEDADGDGILNVHETNTGVYVSPTDTGTDPLVADTDGDGYSDGDEVNLHGTDPNDSQSFPLPQVPTAGLVARALLIGLVLMLGLAVAYHRRSRDDLPGPSSN